MTSLRCSGLIILALVTRVLVAAEAVSFVGLDSETAVFDVVEVVVEVETASPIASVSISVDGWLAGVLTRPPYRLVVNVGDREVVGLGAGLFAGATASAFGRVDQHPHGVRVTGRG